MDYGQAVRTAAVGALVKVMAAAADTINAAGITTDTMTIGGMTATIMGIVMIIAMVTVGADKETDAAIIVMEIATTNEMTATMIIAVHEIIEG